MKKLLSIIVPSYNMERYLDRCLNSMLIDDETLLQMLEILVVNDGSTDRTSEIAHSYESRYPGVFRVIDKANGHYGSCINAGLKAATGEYIRVVDADDCVSKGPFGDFLSWLNTNGGAINPDVIVSGFCKVDPNGAIISRTIYCDSTLVVTPNEWSAKVRPYIGAPAITYKRLLLKELNYGQLEGCPYTDTQWSLIPFVKVRKMVLVPYEVVRYTVGRSGQTMEPKELISGVDKHATVSLDLYKKYLALKDCVCPEASFYIEKALVANAQWMVMLYALGYAGLTPQSTGEMFDKELRRLLPLIYEETNNSSIGRLWKFHYAKEWRRCYSRDSFLFKLFRLKNIVSRALQAGFKRHDA